MNIWVTPLKDIMESLAENDQISLDELWPKLKGSIEKSSGAPEGPKVVLQIQKLLERLSIKRRPEFVNDLRNLAWQETLDSEVRRNSYGRLAQDYNCVFRWVEEGEPGTHPNPIKNTG